MQYILAPDTPGPNSLEVIEVQGVGSFLGDATITWSQNGRVVSSGVGDHTYSFTTGPLGSETDIHVSISSATEGDFSHDFSFLPSLINLVWEADTTAPPFYKGKPLYSAGSSLKVVAFPNVIIGAKAIPASSLSFQWSLGEQLEPDQSGTGRSTFAVSGSQLQQDEDVSVDVNYRGTTVGHAEIDVPAESPQVLFYDKDPLRGTLYDTALPSGISLSSSEITVQAVPYYFSNTSFANGSLSYAWTLNDNDATGPDAARGLLTLRQTGSGTGGAVLGVSIQNNDTDKIVQEAQTALQIIFGGQSSGTSLFGL